MTEVAWKSSGHNAQHQLSLNAGLSFCDRQKTILKYNFIHLNWLNILSIWFSPPLALKGAASIELLLYIRWLVEFTNRTTGRRFEGELEPKELLTMKWRTYMANKEKPPGLNATWTHLAYDGQIAISVFQILHVVFECKYKYVDLY